MVMLGRKKLNYGQNLASGAAKNSQYEVRLAGKIDTIILCLQVLLFLKLLVIKKAE